VTLSDIASFPAAVGSMAMEPNGWAVTGLPANFYSDAKSHVVDGVLLGSPASVRFTPRGWYWNYGDGGLTTSLVAGASWATLALPEFAATPTSHVFAASGEYTVTVTIAFTAEYRFAGSGWVPITGVLELDAPPLSITASDAKTVLVGGDCTQRKGTPGC
jgi:PKD repeat protein